MGPDAAAAAQQGYASRLVQEFDKPGQRIRRGNHDRRRGQQAMRLGRRRNRGGFERDIAGNDDDADAALGHSATDRDFERPRHLFRGRYQLAIAAAFAEQMIGMSFLEIARADFGRRDVGGDRDDRHPRALAIIKPVDQVQIAGAATAGADRKLAGHMRIGAGGERGDLFMADMQPGDAAVPAQRIGKAVQAVADNSVNPLDPDGSERLDHFVGNGRHGYPRARWDLARCFTRV